MEKLLEKLGLNTDATEEQALAKLEEINKNVDSLKEEKSKLATRCEELTNSEKGLQLALEKQQEAYKSLVEDANTKKDKKKPENIFDELSQLK